MTMEHDRQTSSDRDRRTELATKLHQLLDEQLAAGRQGNLARVERLGVRANAVVEALVQSGGRVPTDMDGGNDLGRLYAELILLLRAQQADVQGRLQQLRRVKRALSVYGGNDKSTKRPSCELG